MNSKPDSAGTVEPAAADASCEQGSRPAATLYAGDQKAVNSRSMVASNPAQRRAEAEEDRVLVQAAQAGDRQAFRKLVERHQRAAFAIALAQVRDENDAREIAQEAFLRVYRGLDQFQGSSSFFTWLYRIVTNLSIDLLRRPGRRDLELQEHREHADAIEDSWLPLVAHVAESDPFRMLRRREIAERLRQALEDLPPYHLGVILMREVEGMSYEQMAQAMNVSKGTIMSRLFHARQKLQRALQDCYAEERQGRASTAQQASSDESEELP